MPPPPRSSYNSQEASTQAPDAAANRLARGFVEVQYPFKAADLRAMPLGERRAAVSACPPELLAAMEYDFFNFLARDEQIPPAGKWRVWLILAGRGFGKTKTGAEWCRSQVETGRCRRLALVGRTKAEVRDVMIEGESGLLAVSPPWFRPRYESSRARVVWPNGAVALLFSADEPDSTRGAQQDGAWCDELASWKYPEAWTNLMLGTRRRGAPIQTVVTTTPRQVDLLKDLLKLSSTVMTGGSTLDNIDNLAPEFIEEVVMPMIDTRLGRQEILALMEDDNPAALWKRDLISALRVKATTELARRQWRDYMKRVVVALDPAATSNEESSETGILVCGRGKNNHFYVLDDYTMRGTPRMWAEQALKAFDHWQADLLVAEINNGGEMIEYTLRTVRENLPIKVVHASRGKATRAEPVSAIYERRMAHHLGTLAKLEDQMVNWVPGDPISPDRLDAMVWGATELMLTARGGARRPASTKGRLLQRAAMPL